MEAQAIQNGNVCNFAQLRVLFRTWPGPPFFKQFPALSMVARPQKAGALQQEEPFSVFPPFDQGWKVHGADEGRYSEKHSLHFMARTLLLRSMA